jgi:hypothetical protein
MMSLAELRGCFDEAVADAGTGAADRLCECCVRLLEVDGAAISMLPQGVPWGTVGSSGETSRRLDELQFTFGEGPCLDALTSSQTVMAADLEATDESRWPAFSGAVLELGVRAVFALPIATAGLNVGALDLFRRRPGALTHLQARGATLAAEAAGRPVRELLASALQGGHDADHQPAAAWERVEVYQATGMLIDRLGVGAAEALMRLRGYAFGHDLTASEVAWGIIGHRIEIGRDGPDRPAGSESGTADG